MNDTVHGTFIYNASAPFLPLHICRYIAMVEGYYITITACFYQSDHMAAEQSCSTHAQRHLVKKRRRGMHVNDCVGIQPVANA